MSEVLGVSAARFDRRHTISSPARTQETAAFGFDGNAVSVVVPCRRLMNCLGHRSLDYSHPRSPNEPIRCGNRAETANSAISAITAKPQRPPIEAESSPFARQSSTEKP